jgi:hypothetical protein
MHSYENPSFCWKKIRYGVARRGDVSAKGHKTSSRLAAASF